MLGVGVMSFGRGGVFGECLDLWLQLKISMRPTTTRLRASGVSYEFPVSGSRIFEMDI